jgi:hypothetical protein
VSFNQTSGKVLNLATNADALQKNKYCDINLRTYFMNKGQLDVAFQFNMADDNLAYSYRGHLEPVNLQVVNPAAMPLAMVKITSGKLNSFDFDIRADRNASKGRVSILYNDLKIRLLRPDTVRKQLKRMTIESLYANIFILKHNNPDYEGAPARSFFVNTTRPKEDAFFKTVWKTLLTGIKSCVGYGEKKEQEVKSKLADRAIQKAERQVKKAERKAHREEKKRAKEEQKRLNKEE